MEQSIESISIGSPSAGFEYDPIESSEAVSTGYPPLNFKRIQLRKWFLVVTTTFFLACIGSIMAIIEWARIKGGILHVESTQDYYAFRYAPIVIGSVTTIWRRIIFTTYSRMSPYLSMSAHPNKWNEGQPHRQRTQRILHAYYADAMFAPNMLDIPTLISNGQWLLVAWTFVSSITVFYLMPLKATFIQVTPDRSGWDIAVSNKIGYALISMYGILSIVTLLTMVKLYHRDTGLKWDPVSLADQLALVQGSNFVSLFAGLEACDFRYYKQRLRERAPGLGSLRLGYWKHRQNGTIWHGLAFVSGTSCRRNSPDFCTICSILEGANPSPAAGQQGAENEQFPRKRSQASLENRKKAGIAATPKRNLDVAGVELSAQHEIRERRKASSDGSVSASSDRLETQLTFAQQVQ